MKKLLMLAAALVLGSSLIFAGGARSQGSTSGKTLLRIVTWTNPASVEAIKALSAKFMVKYPDIAVEVTDIESNQVDGLLRTRMAANDVEIISHQGGLTRAQVDWAPGEKPTWQEMIDAGNYLDITNEPWLGAWGSGVDSCRYNGKVYGVSVGSTVVTGVFYNKKLFADNGWQVPKTWAEFERLCAAIKAKGIAPMTVGGADGWPYTMLMNDIVASVEPDHDGLIRALWSGERKFTDAKSLEILRRGEFLNQNFEDGFKAIPYSAAPGRFAAGRSAMMPDGNWNVTEILKADPNFQVGYFPLPGTEPGLQFQGKSDLSFHVNAKSPYKDGALKWLEFLSDKANYTEFINTIGFIPTMAGVTISNKFLNEEILPYVTNLKPLWELNWRAPSGVGQYAGYSAYQYLKSAGGPVAAVEELAQLAQKDFDDGKAAAKK
ncbi:MAG: extracellular solute-binding protein [Treponema sp.]|jgi:raffinose/stachyose/melibiose transport system substrate-binding protein|nr:extracellular solute-binding protein [Treponema sp.]